MNRFLELCWPDALSSGHQRASHTRRSIHNIKYEGLMETCCNLHGFQKGEHLLFKFVAVSMLIR